MESVEVESVAIPLPFKGELPSETPPDMKVIVPVGVPFVVELTVAVRVTDCAIPTGLLDDAKADIVPAACTVCAAVTV